MAAKKKQRQWSHKRFWQAGPLSDHRSLREAVDRQKSSEDDGQRVEEEGQIALPMERRRDPHPPGVPHLILVVRTEPLRNGQSAPRAAPSGGGSWRPRQIE